MTGMSTLNPTTQRSIDDAQITTIAARYGDMQINDQEQLRSKLSNFGGIVPVVLDLLRKSTDPTTKDTLCIPAMLVAGVAGRKYQSKYDQAHFITRILREMGREGEDWGALAKAYVFGGAFAEYSNVATDGNLGSNLGNLGSDLAFSYECMEEGPVTFRSNCGPSTKFYFVTPLFALRLLMKIQSPRQSDYVDCFIALGQAMQVIHDGGQVQVGDKTFGQVKDGYDDELRIVKKRRMNLELDRYEMETKLMLQEKSAQTMLMLQEGQQKHMAFMMDMYTRASNASDDRDSIELRALVMNQLKVNTTNQQLAIQDTDEEVIDHVGEAEKIMKRKLQDGEKSSFGKALCKAYQEKYNEKPPMYDKRAGNGHPIKCRMYLRKHISLIQEVCASHFKMVKDTQRTLGF